MEGDFGPPTAAGVGLRCALVSEESVRGRTLPLSFPAENTYTVRYFSVYTKAIVSRCWAGKAPLPKWGPVAAVVVGPGPCTALDKGVTCQLRSGREYKSVDECCQLLPDSETVTDSGLHVHSVGYGSLYHGLACVPSLLSRQPVGPGAANTLGCYA